MQPAGPMQDHPGGWCASVAALRVHEHDSNALRQSPPDRPCGSSSKHLIERELCPTPGGFRST